VTSSFAALTVVGPLARETFARFCAIDLRPRVAQVWALRPGSVGRQPAILIREGELRFLFLFGWATSEYMWSVVADAGTHLGGHPLGVDQLTAFPITEREAEAVDV
jgi:sarcosine oxidase gamma subunit